MNIRRTNSWNIFAMIIEHFDSIEHIEMPGTSSNKYIANDTDSNRLHIGVL